MLNSFLRNLEKYENILFICFSSTFIPMLDSIPVCITRIIVGEEEVPCNERPSNYETVGTRVGKGCKQEYFLTSQNGLNHDDAISQVPLGKRESLLSKYETEKVE